MTSEVIGSALATLALLAPVAAWIRRDAPDPRVHTRAHTRRVTRSEIKAHHKHRRTR